MQLRTEKCPLTDIPFCVAILRDATWRFRTLLDTPLVFGLSLVHGACPYEVRAQRQCHLSLQRSGDFGFSPTRVTKAKAKDDRWDAFIYIYIYIYMPVGHLPPQILAFFGKVQLYIGAV